MRTCKNCGSVNGDAYKFCKNCGVGLQDESAEADRFGEEPSAQPANDAAVNEPNDKLIDSVPEEQSESKQVPVEQKLKAGFKQRLVAAKDKTLAFEAKHSIILNAFIAVISIVVLFVTLFAPIKVVLYNLDGSAFKGTALAQPVYDKERIHVSEWGSDNDDGYVISVVGYNLVIPDTADGKTCHYVEINQSIWQMIGAIGYINLDYNKASDRKKAAEINTEIQNAYKAAWNDLYIADLVASDVVSLGEAVEKAFGDRLSDVNYLAYALAAGGGGSFGDLFLNEISSQAFVSLMLGLVITILSLITAILSLVQLIIVIVNVIKKRQAKSPFKFMSNILGLSTAAMILSAIAPMTKIGGGMFAVFIFVSIMYIIGAIVASLVFKKMKTSALIKRSLLVLITFIATGLLSTNIITHTAHGITRNAPIGYGFGNLLSSIHHMLENEIGPMICLAYSVPLLGGMFGAAVSAVTSFMKELACIEQKHAPERAAFRNSIAAFVLIVITGVIMSVVMPMIVGGFKGAKIGLRAQTYVAAAFFFIAVFVSKLYRPEDEDKRVDLKVAVGAAGAPTETAAEPQSGTDVSAAESRPEINAADHFAEDSAPAVETAANGEPTE